MTQFPHVNPLSRVLRPCAAISWRSGSKGARTFAVSSRTFGQVQGLPEQQPGVTFIVSAMVLDRVNREDVVAPDTGATAVRKDGQVWAVRGLVRS